MNDREIKPWLGDWYISGVQDNPEYWNQPEILIPDTTRATVEQVLENPMAGWGDWTPDGMVDTNTTGGK